MAFTRKLLKSMGIEEDKIDQIIEAHVETVDGIKSKFSDYDTVKNSLSEVTKERDELKNQPSKDETEKIVNLEKKIEEYEGKELLQAKQNAYKEVLKNAGIDEKRFKSILKVTNFNELEIENGKFKDAEKLAENVKTEFADFILQSKIEEHKPNTPPTANNDSVSYTREEIKKMTPQQINENWDAIKTALKGDVK